MEDVDHDMLADEVPVAKTAIADTFESQGLKSFLEIDARPTVVLDRKRHDAVLLTASDIVYQNPTFRHLFAGEDGTVIRNWILSTYCRERDANDEPFDRDPHGRTWSVVTLDKRWQVVSCTAAFSDGFGSLFSSTPGTPRREASRTRPTHSPIKSPSKLPNLRRARSWELTWTAEHSGSAVEALGWDRFDAPLTAHEQMLMNLPWEDTCLGAITTWPGPLRQAVSTMIKNPDPRALIWGSDQVLIYNEACILIFGEKHPNALGALAKDVFSELWDNVKPMFDSAMYQGKAFKIYKAPYVLHRHGFLEETFFHSTLLPIAGSDDRGNGVLDQFSECTLTVMNERRQKVVTHVNDICKNAQSILQLWTLFPKGLQPFPEDIPFAVIYARNLDQRRPEEPSESQAEGDPGSPNTEYRCSATMGIASDQLGLPDIIRPFADSDAPYPLQKALRQVITTHDVASLSDDDHTLPAELSMLVPGRGHGDKIRTICVLPVGIGSDIQPVSFVVLGLNPRRPFDEAQQLFARVLRDGLVNAAAIINLPEESRRQKKAFEEIQLSLTQRLRATTLDARRIEERFSRMAETSPVGMYVFDGQLRPESVNDTYLTMMGIDRDAFFSAATASSSWWQENCYEDDIKGVNENMLSVVTEKKQVSVEFRIKRLWHSVDQNTGKTVSGPTHLVATSVPELDKDGNLRAVHGWLTDVSHERFTQRLLSQRLEEAQESKRQSENFIDMTSHEMRNPLSAILQSADGILALMDGGKLPMEDVDNMTISADTADSIIDAAHTVIFCAQHQKRIVDDILTLSKLDSNLLIISPDRTCPSQLLNKALKMYEAELERADIKSRVEIRPSIEALNIEQVMMDNSRVLQVVINLLTNAIKFTQYSKIREIVLTLDATLDPPVGGMGGINFIPARTARQEQVSTSEWGTGQEVFLQFSVKDSGKGLNDEEMALLFQRFSQASPKTYKHYGGSGLGLVISRALTELQGGQIGVCSTSGKGSTFAFYVKARRWVPGTPITADHNRCRWDVYTPTVGESPVAFFSTGSDSIGDVPSPRRKTVDNTLSPVQQFKRPGVTRAPNSYNLASEPTSSHAVLAPASPSLEPEQLHILIVEDNIINQKVMAKQIRAAGHIVHVANHGEEALDFMRRTDFWTSNHNPSSSSPQSHANPFLASTLPTSSTFMMPMIPLSVILMDQEMPTMDGLSCVKRIRELQRQGDITGHVPVIAVTANARSEQITTALSAGMDEVVTKPFRVPQVVERARGLVARIRGREMKG